MSSCWQRFLAVSFFVSLASAQTPAGAPAELSAADWAGIRAAHESWRSTVSVGSLAQQAYMKASNGAAGHDLGYAVSVSGDTVVVGARGESGGASFASGGGGAPFSGAAYVFVRSGTTWTQQAYLKASVPGAGDGFGSSVGVSGDTIVVGAHDEDSSATGVNGNPNNDDAMGSGAAYVFVRSGTSWSQQAYLKPSNTEAGDVFGTVAVSGDTIVVGASGEDSSSPGVNGNQADNGAGNSGAAYVFVRTGTIWSQQAYLKSTSPDPGDGLGSTVSVFGDTIVVGSGDASSATGVNGNESDTSAPFSGAAYVFVRNGTVWSQEAYLKASNTAAADVFGLSVAVSGDTIVVGAVGEDSSATGVNGNQASNNAPFSGAAYVFVRNGTTWSQEAYLKASNTGPNDRFGESVSVAGDRAVIGALAEDSDSTGVNGGVNNLASNAGAAYVFVRSGTSWSQEAFLKASNTEAQDSFGLSVAVSGDTVVVGAIGEDGSSTVVNGDQGNGAAGSGAVYAFSASSAAGFCDATDGALAACPCASAGNPDSGCDNAQTTGGVRLDLLAQTTAPNGATLRGSGFPTAAAPTAVVMRSNALDIAGPVVFGDGLRCIGSSSLVLLGATTPVSGTSTHAFGHDAAAGAGTFYYQVWYRNTPPAYCTPAGFNLSSGRTLVW